MVPLVKIFLKWAVQSLGGALAVETMFSVASEAKFSSLQYTLMLKNE